MMKFYIMEEEQLNKETVMKQLNEMTLLDRFLFSEVMEDPEVSQIILEVIFGTEIRLLERPQAEKEFHKTPADRSIRIDVYAKDEDGNVYDTEVQRQGKGNLPKRSRLYQGLIDSTLLPPGILDFNEMKNCYVIIITPFDILGLSYYCYTFRMRCDEAPEKSLEDGGIRIFLNTRGTIRNSVSPELVELLHYIENVNGETEVTFESGRLERLHKRIQVIRNSKEIGVKYMQRWEERLLDREEARAEGTLLKLISIIRKMKNKGMDTGAMIELLEEDEAVVLQIYHLICEYPDSTDETIYQKLVLS